MKEPKAWKWPRLYMCAFEGGEDPGKVADLRIIYPNDQLPKRTYTLENEDERTFDIECPIVPCWYRLEQTTPELQRRAMFRWAKRNKVKIEFVGEIKP